MALVLPGGIEYEHDNDRTGPLENSLPRPLMFHGMHVASQIQFEENARVVLPRGMACSIQPASTETRAPLPRATRASSHSAVGQTSMRQCFSAFLCCRGITYFSQVYQTSDPASMMASSTKSELSAACTIRRESPKVLLGNGPHGSQTPRSIALTLLLPRSWSFKNHMQDIYLLDAYSAIAQVRRQPNRLSGSQLHKDHASKEPENFITNKVRFNLMCGEDDVGIFLKNVEITDKEVMIPKDWDKKPAFCVSFVKNASSVCSGYAVIDDNAVVSAQSAIYALQKALSAIQMQFAGDLVLPTACVHSENVDAENASFISMQSDLQWEFRKLFCPDPTISVQDDVLERFRAVHGCGDCSSQDRRSFDSCRPKDRLVRISPPIQDVNGCVSAADPSVHMVGMLLYSNQEQFEDYLRRCRLLVPKVAFHSEWPVFGLHPPMEEEIYANVSVMYTQPSIAYIGNYVNLFGPRRQCGERVTEYENCRVARLQCIVEYIDNTLGRGLMVLPCTSASTIPAVSNASAMSSAFVRLMADLRANVLRPQCGPMPLLNLQLSCDHIPNNTASFSTTASVETASMEASKNTDGDDPSYSYLIGSQVGHPCITCGEAYDVMEANADSYSVGSSNFYSIVEAVVTKFGRETPVKDVMNACAHVMRKVDSLDDLVGDMKIRKADASSECCDKDVPSPRKRSRTPDIDFTRRFVTDERGVSFSRFLRLASMKLWKVGDFRFPLQAERAMTFQNVLDDLLVPFGQEKTRPPPTKKESKNMYKAVKAVSDTDPTRLAVSTVSAILGSMVERIKEDLSNFEVHVIYNKRVWCDDTPTMYTAMLDTVPVEFRASPTTTLLKERTVSIQSVLIDMNPDDSTGDVHIETFKSFRGHCTP